ncbi:hypothetical protein EVAR_100676_1 [Eumeta japonica]|uniref:Uncharacterized protein n=1 Tax=Eumeta variegata TaxID=151549 RepID=A0A4C2A818_EUMVA|nr:hypothetical protein EVAR_100676_1 [Eumeta japonica]
MRRRTTVEGSKETPHYLVKSFGMSKHSASRERPRNGSPSARPNCCRCLRRRGQYEMVNSRKTRPRERCVQVTFPVSLTNVAAVRPCAARCGTLSRRRSVGFRRLIRFNVRHCKTRILHVEPLHFAAISGNAARAAVRGTRRGRPARVRQGTASTRPRSRNTTDPEILKPTDGDCILDNFLSEQRRFEAKEESARFVTDEQMLYFLADMFGAASTPAPCRSPGSCCTWRCIPTNRLGLCLCRRRMYDFLYLLDWLKVDLLDVTMAFFVQDNRPTRDRSLLMNGNVLCVLTCKLSFLNHT